MTFAAKLRELADDLERVRLKAAEVDAVAARMRNIASALEGWSAAPTATCAGPACGRPIVWAKLAGRVHPCDPPMLAIIDGDGKIHRGRQSHYATCPNADDFRRPDGTR
jgi:hypothetical protein